MPSAKKRSRSGAQGFKLEPKKAAKKFLDALSLSLESARLSENGEIVLKVKSRRAVRIVTIRSPMGRACQFTAASCKPSVLFTKVGNPAQ
jgi:hypothetical protein